MPAAILSAGILVSRWAVLTANQYGQRSRITQTWSERGGAAHCFLGVKQGL
jgi:hypothetical protein